MCVSVHECVCLCVRTCVHVGLRLSECDKFVSVRLLAFVKSVCSIVCQCVCVSV